MTTAFLEVTNNATGQLDSGITDSATSLTLGSGEGAAFPSAFPFHVSINDEIIQVGARSGDVLSSLTRAQQSTSAAAHSAGDAAELRLTAQHLSDLNDAVNLLETAFDPIATLDEYDDFIVRSTETGEVGKLPWNIVNGSVGAGTVVANHPGILRWVSSAVAGQVSILQAVSANVIDMDDNFDLTFIVNPVNTNNLTYRFGLINTPTSNPPPNGIYFEIIRNTDSAWYAVTRASGSQTRTSMGVYGNWHKLQMKRNGSSIEFYADGTLIATHTTDIPTAVANWVFQSIPVNAQTRSLDVDFARLKVTGLVR